ncbi:dethiobiotin synthase [Thermoleptolyngbya sichuanensis A183]|uniref:ATP-dependent dethiobiotin synthetase BioD n=1 Tax=Thermoleptolyngbya sichuanensis A183 TaxID=2737172 RepID=A0A6M8BBS7_9CYAN|nr:MULTISPECIES: dethiobiotin synthase [Thermoleptolyngbya]MDG2615352.1 dethiobiotin synthase [Thermoleptolyngbya sichuanensis XZ-Cy5]QKD81041.1 dethiobiotin synthase [Thermoleptolyngbya sichuanensis A183]
MFPEKFFITGTDTNVGKTVVSALLTLGLNASYWKPIQSGLDPISDTDYVRKVTGLDDSHFLPERFTLTQPLSPHAAAEIDGVQIYLSDFQLPSQLPYKPLIIEGAGGLMVPLNEEDFVIDLIRQFQLPVCLVARSTLGTINHTLLSLAQLRRMEIPILGVIVNGPKNEGNRAAIAHYGNVPILAELEPLAEVNPATLKQAFDQLFRA